MKLTDRFRRKKTKGKPFLFEIFKNLVNVDSVQAWSVCSSACINDIVISG
jgi:hypothetical protein